MMFVNYFIGVRVPFTLLGQKPLSLHLVGCYCNLLGFKIPTLLCFGSKGSLWKEPALIQGINKEHFIYLMGLVNIVISYFLV